jgi:hypothetical protein
LPSVEAGCAQSRSSATSSKRRMISCLLMLSASRLPNHSRKSSNFSSRL